jgi:lipoprotein NlpD
MQRHGWLSVTLACLFLASCASAPNYAPVTEVAAIQPIPRSGIHRVVHGESLYEIAWKYGLDYRYLAARNHLTSPYILHTGQVLVLRGKAVMPAAPEVVTAASASHKTSTKNVSVSAADTTPIKAWAWPAKGRILDSYSAKNKGLDIGGALGAPITATAKGEVVYAGNGLKGYGNLIIIKHNSVYLSAYAYAKRLLVREGQAVKQGQKIAEMGRAGSGNVMLHFEIRRAGQPINPLSLLANHSASFLRTRESILNS